MLDAGSIPAGGTIRAYHSVQWSLKFPCNEDFPSERRLKSSKVVSMQRIPERGMKRGTKATFVFCPGFAPHATD